MQTQTCPTLPEAGFMLSTLFSIIGIICIGSLLWKPLSEMLDPPLRRYSNGIFTCLPYIPNKSTAQRELRNCAAMWPRPVGVHSMQAYARNA